MYLQQRGPSWCFQIRVPSDLVHVLGVSPIRVTLGRVSAQTARRHARRLCGRVEERFETMRQDDETQHHDHRDAIIAELRELVAQKDKLREKQLHLLELRLLSERLAEQEELGGRLREARTQLAALEETVAALPKARENSGRVEKQMVALREELGLIKQSVSESGNKTPEMPLLSAAAGDFLQAKEEALKGSGFLQRQRTAIQAFVSVAGDKPIDAYRARDLQDFVTVLGRVPRDWRKLRRFEDMTLREVAEYNDGLREPLRCLTTTSIKDYVRAFRQFWRAVRADYPQVAEITAAPLSTPRTAARPTARGPLEADEINAWLAHAAQEPRPDDRWLPLLGLLTGARLGELVFLQGADIQNIGRHWVLNLKGDIVGPDGVKRTRQTKTSAADRIIALHDFLKEAGFVDWARQRSGFIFDQLHRSERPRAVASKRMSRQMKNLGIHLPQEGVFHSLRHTTKDWLRKNGIRERTEDLQIGHALASVSKRYGRRSLAEWEVELLASQPLPSGIDFDPYRH